MSELQTYPTCCFAHSPHPTPFEASYNNGVFEPSLIAVPKGVVPQPKHLLIIPDAQRRWAKEQCLPYIISYMQAAKVGINIVRHFLNMPACRDLSFFLIAPHTLKRPLSELLDVFKGLNYFLDWLLSIYKDIEIYHHGSLIGIPNDICIKLDILARGSKSSNHDKRLHLLIGYSGTKCLDIEGSNTSLGFLPPIEKIYRAGGEKRLSDAPILESRSAILCIDNMPFPELTMEKIQDIFLEEKIKSTGDDIKNFYTFDL